MKKISTFFHETPEISLLNNLLHQWPFEDLHFEGLRGDTLILSSSSPAVLFDYSFKKKQLLKTLHKKFPQSRSLLKEIKFLVKFS